MAYALVNTAGERDYHGTVVEFLEAIEAERVRGVVMVAITDNGPYLSWNCTPLDMAAAASVVQAQSVLNYMDLEADEDEDSV